MTNCEDCGCKVYDDRCTNCHEELYILDQLMEQDLCASDEFLQKCEKQREEIKQKKSIKRCAVSD